MRTTQVRAQMLTVTLTFYLYLEVSQTRTDGQTQNIHGGIAETYTHTIDPSLIVPSLIVIVAPREPKAPNEGGPKLNIGSDAWERLDISSHHNSHRKALA